MTNNMYVDSTNMKHNSNFSLLNVLKSLAGEVDFSVEWHLRNLDCCPVCSCSN